MKTKADGILFRRPRLSPTGARYGRADGGDPASLFGAALAELNISLPVRKNASADMEPVPHVAQQGSIRQGAQFTEVSVAFFHDGEQPQLEIRVDERSAVATLKGREERLELRASLPAFGSDCPYYDGAMKTYVEILWRAFLMALYSPKIGH